MLFVIEIEKNVDNTLFAFTAESSVNSDQGRNLLISEGERTGTSGFWLLL